jgi:serine/threonine protein kinase
MPLDESELTKDASETAAALESTPRMGEEDLEYSGRLSASRSRPPAKVPGYEQEVFVGRGAFGEVWKAIDSNSGRSVAIKFYSQRGGLDWSHMAREVEKLQYLFADRHVVQLFDVGWDADPPYYVMEYMAYGSLEDRLRQGPLPVAEAVRIIRDIARGLVHAHDKGILHCDLKPSNIMLDQDGTPRLADFGQARLEHERAPALGTLFYMAPEQASLSASPDAQWDVYALGTIFYRVLCGKLPYLESDIASAVTSHGPIEQRLKNYAELIRSSPRPAAHRRCPGVDKSLADIVDRCLAVDPKHRYRNAQSVLYALDAREARRAQRPLLLLGLLGPALVVLVMGLVGSYLLQTTLATARNELLDRSHESDQFAARSVAERFALDIDKRWRILEEEAGYRSLQKWLQTKPTDETWQSSQADFQRWIAERHAARNLQFSAGTRTSYFFALDIEGRIRAVSPHDEGLLGRYFGYRDYYHGQGRDIPDSAPVPPPIAEPYRSNVFRSQPTNRPAVGFSAPILASTSDSGKPEVIGVLVMETALGHFADFSGSRAQFATLVDLRPDETKTPGLLVEHPYLEQQVAKHIPVGQFYVQGESLRRLDEIRDQRLAASGPAAQPTTTGDFGSETGNDKALSIIEHYTDPVGGSYEGDWLAAVEPVFVERGTGALVDSGWAVLVEERTSDTLRPLTRVRSLMAYGGLVGLGLVTLVIGGLWGIVVLAVKAPRWARGWRFWKGIAPAGTSTAQSSGSLSAGSAASSTVAPRQ